MRYFFHVHDGVSILDTDGTELPDDEAARQEAMSSSLGLLGELGERVWNGAPWQMQVLDETGREAFLLVFRGKIMEGVKH